jgi:hypothetical protein
VFGYRRFGKRISPIFNVVLEERTDTLPRNVGNTTSDVKFFFFLVFLSLSK